MKLKHILSLTAGLAVLGGAGTALANHVSQVDPATVPAGFLVSHTSIGDFPVSSVARAVKPGGADVLMQHIRLGANAATPWHSHPGPAIVTVARGEITWEAGEANACHRVLYTAGNGFVDAGFGHVHRAIAGPDGADLYVVYILPAGSTTHIIGADPAPECVS